MSIPASIPEDEAERLATLTLYDILDTPPELAIDRLTTLASEICNAPISLVSLVDRERQWFKSRCGLDLAEIPRSVAFCAYAILSDEVFVVPDATRDERFRDSPLVTGYPHIRSYAGAPLIARNGHRLGTLCVIHDEVTGLEPKQISQLERLAAILVDALDMRLALREAECARERIQIKADEIQMANDALHDQASGLVRLAEDSEMLIRENERNHRFIQALIETVPIPIFSRDERQYVTHSNPAFAALLGREPAEIVGKHISDLYGIEDMAQIVEQDELLLADPTGRQTYSRTVTPEAQRGPREIILQKAVIREDDGTVQGIVGAIVDVTEQKALQAHLERLATTDPLTGAANRRAFMNRADSELKRALRYGSELSLIAFDLDEFKAINDIHGHHAGDEVLKLVCNVCASLIRESVDILARLGGEEFAILLPGTGLQGAETLAVRLREALAGQRLAIEGRSITFTASFGVAAFDRGRGCRSFEEILKRADQSVYASKDGGRNRVTVFDDDADIPPRAVGSST